jgi:hypothetical protein
VNAGTRAQGGEDGFAEVVKVFGPAEEAGVIGGELVHHAGQGSSAAVGFHVVVVVLKGFEAKLAQLLAQAGCDQALLAAAEIEAEVLMREPADLLVLAGVENGDAIDGSGGRVRH